MYECRRRCMLLTLFNRRKKKFNEYVGRLLSGFWLILVWLMSDQRAFPLYLAKRIQRSISKANNRFCLDKSSNICFLFCSDTLLARSCNLCMFVASIGLDRSYHFWLPWSLGRGGLRNKYALNLSVGSYSTKFKFCKIFKWVNWLRQMLCMNLTCN